MYKVYYEIKNGQGCLEYFTELETATKRFNFFKGNSNYKKAILLDTNGKSVLKFER